MKTQVKQIKRTSDYSLFSHDPTNRSVEKVSKILRSLKKYGFLEAYPLHCVQRNGKLIIKDGQHRFQAARELGIPVWYVVADEAKDISIPEINSTQTKWSYKDYCHSFSQQGKADYDILLAFYKNYRLPINTCASLLIGNDPASGNARESILAGTFKVRNEAFATRVALIIAKLQPNLSFGNNVRFIDAVAKCCRVPSFKDQRLIEIVEKYPSMLTHQATTELFLEAIDKAYNYKLKQQIPLAFEARTIAKHRNPVFKG